MYQDTLIGMYPDPLALMNEFEVICMLIGGYLWGALSDTYGRRKIMIVCLLMNGVFGFLSAFAQSYWFFVFCRFMSGVGVGGSIPVFWAYFAEFQPRQTRGQLLSVIASFWMVGQLVTAGIAWILIPMQDLELYLGSFLMRSWRIFLALSTFICLSSSVLILFIPESPKFLLDKGRRHEALQVLVRMYCVNKKSTDCPIRMIELPPRNRDDQRSHRTRSWIGKLKGLVRNLFEQSFSLLRKPNLAPMVLLIGINFALSFGYYGLNLWFPELFTRSRASPSDSGSICSHETHNQSLPSPTGPNCDPLVIGNPSVFRDSFLIALSQLPSNVLCVLFLDRIGRKPVFVVGIVLTTLSVFLIYAVRSPLVLSCVFSAFSVLCWNCLDAFGVELFPTHLRSTALGVSLLFARIGAILGNLSFGFLIDEHCEIPLIIVATLLTLGGILSCFLPEPARRIIN